MVVMGHYNYQMNSVAWFDWIFSFHMPLFFITGGYLWRCQEKKLYDKGIFYYVKKQVQSLLIPYSIFFLLSFIVRGVVMRNINNKSFLPITIEEWMMLMKAFLFGGDLQFELVGALPLWFLQLYFIAKIIFFVLHWYRQKNRIAACSVIGIIIILIKPYQTYLFLNMGEWPGSVFHISALPAALIFMECGYILCRCWNETFLQKVLEDCKRRSIIIVLMLGMGIVISYVYPASVAHIRSYCYIIGACATVFAFYLLMWKHQPVLLCYLGKNSLIILGMHGLVLSFHQRFLQPYIFPKWEGAFLYIVNCAIVIAMLIICIMVWQKLAFFRKYYESWRAK